MIRYINTRVKRFSAYLIAFILLLLGVIPTAFLLVKTFQWGRTRTDDVMRMCYIAFDLTDGVMEAAEKVISENRDFFLTPENKPVDYLDINEEIKRIKQNNPYMDKIVFFRKDNPMLLTDVGTVKKENFFTNEYQNDTYNLAYWEQMMQSYSAPSIIPDSHYGDNGKGRRLFVISNINYIYNLGILFFIDTAQFIDYCGLNLEGRDKIAFYNSEGEYLFGNIESQSEPVPFAYSGELEKITLSGEYERVVQFNNKNIVLSIKTRNPFFLFVIALTLLGDLLVIYLVIRIVRSKRGNMALIAENGMDVRSLLFACMRNRELTERNMPFLNQAIINQGNGSFTLYAIIFHNLKNRKQILDLNQLNRKLPNTLLALERIGNVLILFANIPEDKDSADEAYMRKQILPFVNTFDNVADIELVQGQVFTELEHISDSYKALRRKILLYDDEKTQIELPDIQSLQNRVRQYGNSENLSETLKYLRKKLEEAQNSMPFQLYCLYLAHVYFTVAESVDSRFLNASYPVFLETIKAGEMLYDAEGETNMLLNILNEYRSVLDTKIEHKQLFLNVLDYIQKNYKSDLSLSDVAERFNIEAKNLSIFFKRSNGSGFMEYVTNLRMEEAKRLLSETDRPVKEIYEELGYISASTFTTVFRRKVGESPTQYRNRRRKK